jgi:prophage regulatory protein
MTKAEVQIPVIYADLPTVAAIVSLSEATVQKMVREESFPRPRQLSGRRVAWLVREVTEWAEARPPSELLPPANTGVRKTKAVTA